MSQFSHRLNVWFVVLLLLLAGILLQVRSARGAAYANLQVIVAGASIPEPSFFRS